MERRPAPDRETARGVVSRLVRRAGTGIDAAGARVVWSVAEGRRGRRWREARSVAGGGVVSSLLLETDAAGRFSHAELSTDAGLLTLHPEVDGTVHGNVVTPTGVTHVVGLPWSPDGVLIVEGSTIAAAVAAHALRRSVPSGRRTSVAAIVVELNAAVRAAEVSVERSGEDAWRIGAAAIEVDDDGLPSLAGARIWPLETG